MLTAHWKNDHENSDCMKLHKHLLNPSNRSPEESQVVVRGNAVLVRPPLVPVLCKGEAEDSSAHLLRCFSSPQVSPQSSLLAVSGAARQQLGRGGWRGGGAPDIEHFPFRARWETPAQVAGAGAGAGWGGQGALAAIQVAGVVVCWAFAWVSGGADVGGAVVVGLEARALRLATLAPEDTDERQLKLPVVTGVDDGVQAAVEVAQPEDDFEEDFRRAQVHIERPWREI